MTDYIFLGPSLPRNEARTIHAGDTVEYLPPVAMGDLYTLVRTRARPGDRIAIIDGLFEQVPAVWHKEVLFALQEGIVVYGASSMGALRASELHPFGMRGIGRIFEAYRDGTIEDDDEVVVAHATGDQGYRALSSAMVSLRFGLSQLRDAGVIDAKQCAHLTQHAKAQHYSARSWAATFAEARAQGMNEQVLTALRQMAAHYDAKADDARTLLRILAGQEQAPATQEAPPFMLEQTAFWVGLTRSQDARIQRDKRGALQAHDAEVLNHVRAGHADRDEVLAEAALLRLADENAAGWEPQDRDRLAALMRIASRNKLKNQDAIRAWRRHQQLEDADEWRALLDLEARRHTLLQRLMPGLEPHMVAALKSSSRYRDAVEEVTRMRDRFGDNRTKTLSLDDAGVDAAALQGWYEARFGAMYPDPETHARQLGFETLRDFIAEVLAAYLLEREGHALQEAALA